MTNRWRIIAGGLVTAALVAAALAVVSARTEGTAARSTTADVKEDLTYEVRWAWFRLGTVRVRTWSDGSARADIDSYPSVPFVDLHSIHRSRMDPLEYSLFSSALEKRDQDWWGMEYLHDRASKQVVVQEILLADPDSTPYRRTTKDTIQLTSPSFVDGLSIAFFPRQWIRAESTVVVPTVLYGKLGTTVFWFERKHTTEDIDALEHPVRVVEVKGTTSVEGIFGMTGDFTGWFSDDRAAVPIKGKLKVLIGSVTLELMKWEREGWNPPQEQ